MRPANKQQNAPNSQSMHVYNMSIQPTVRQTSIDRLAEQNPSTGSRHARAPAWLRSRCQGHTSATGSEQQNGSAKYYATASHSSGECCLQDGETTPCATVHHTLLAEKNRKQLARTVTQAAEVQPKEASKQAQNLEEGIKQAHQDVQFAGNIMI